MALKDLLGFLHAGCRMCTIWMWGSRKMLCHMELRKISGLHNINCLMCAMWPATNCRIYAMLEIRCALDGTLWAVKYAPFWLLDVRYLTLRELSNLFHVVLMELTDLCHMACRESSNIWYGDLPMCSTWFWNDSQICTTLVFQCVPCGPKEVFISLLWKLCNMCHMSL
jgi:hypothetical protein